MALGAHGEGARAGGAPYERRRPEETALYGVVQEELESFLARARSRERTVPRFVERELRAYLRCGILAHGFVRVHCDECGLDRVVAFSCKRRGFCPSCGGRRMADTAAHLVDRVLPEVPVRQWVLSLPFALRYRLAYDAGLTSAVLGVFVRTVFASLRRRARRQWNVARGQCGAVTFVQRFGDALNLNLHFHSLVLDGVYETSPSGRPRFHPLPPPDDAEVARAWGRWRRVSRACSSGAPCAQQFRVMAFAQLSYRESLRDIEACLSAQAAKALADLTSSPQSSLSSNQLTLFEF